MSIHDWKFWSMKSGFLYIEWTNGKLYKVEIENYEPIRAVEILQTSGV